MLLDLSKLIVSPGASVQFQTQVDLSDLTFGSCRPATQPVIAAGTVKNTADVLIMDGTIVTTLHGICDRCASSFVREVSFPLHAVLVSELASEQDEDQWTFVLQDSCADLVEIVSTTFVLAMDSKLLCKDDCKGLCCRCGKNLNDGPCDCKPEMDSRMAVLQQLLDKKKSF